MGKPYVGARPVLQAAGLQRFAERFVTELGVESFHDLVELTQADLIKLGLGSSWPRFAAALERAKTKAIGEGLIKADNRYQRHRRAAANSILLQGANATLVAFLAAGGVTKYEGRLRALGVTEPRDLHGLTLADLSELGMHALHERRFLSATKLAPPSVDPIAVAQAARAASTASATGVLACDALLRPLQLASFCAPLASAFGLTSETAALDAVCRLRQRHLEDARMHLVQRRRLAVAAHALCIGNASTAAAANAPVPSGGGHVPPPATATTVTTPDAPLLLSYPRSGAHQTAGPLDGCRHVFLDVGANVGMNFHHLFQWNAPHHRYRHGAMQQWFDQYFGLSRDLRRASVCAIGIEANPHHTATLTALGAQYRQQGVRAYFMTETAAASREGTITFTVQNATKASREVHEWGASVYHSSIAGLGAEVHVRALDLAEWIRTTVLGRRLRVDDIAATGGSLVSTGIAGAGGRGSPAADASTSTDAGAGAAAASASASRQVSSAPASVDSLVTPSIVMKMDIEGKPPPGHPSRAPACPSGSPCAPKHARTRRAQDVRKTNLWLARGRVPVSALVRPFAFAMR